MFSSTEDKSILFTVSIYVQEVKNYNTLTYISISLPE